jgi:hypothetical protein
MHNPKLTRNLILIFISLITIATHLDCLNKSSVPEQVPGSISGTVRDAKDSSALKEVEVVLSGTQKTTRTDSGGYLFLADVPSGEYTVHFKKEHYDTLTRSILLKSGQDLVLDSSIYMHRNYGMVEGIVRASGNLHPLSDVKVSIVNDPATFSDSAITDSAGSYKFNFLGTVTSNYLVTYEKKGYRFVRKYLSVFSGDSIFLQDTVMAFLKLAGAVFDSNTGRPLENANIIVDSQIAESDSLGRFSLVDLLPVDTGYSITISGKYYRTISFRDTFAVGDSILGSFYLSAPRGIFQGKFILQGENNFTGIEVKLSTKGLPKEKSAKDKFQKSLQYLPKRNVKNPDTTFTAFTDTLGMVQISGVPVGHCEVNARKAGFKPINTIVEILENNIAKTDTILAIE